MICEIDIPWTPRAIKKSATPMNPGVSFDTLLGIIMDALKPFDEARIVLSAAMTTRTLELSISMNAVEFARKRLDFEPDTHQSRVLLSLAHRGILNCTRQWGKSTVCAIKALHRAFYTSGKDVIIACPSQRQSAEVLNKVAGFLQILGIPRRGDGSNRYSLKLPNGSRIIALPGQIQQTVRGFSALSLLIIDDAAQVTDSLYLALRPMLAVGRGDLWLLSTPYGERGFFYHAWIEGGNRWECFTLPATECARISPEFLEEEREAGGARYFGQEYLCEFHSTDDALFDETLPQRRINGGEISGANTSGATAATGRLLISALTLIAS